MWINENLFCFFCNCSSFGVSLGLFTIIVNKFLFYQWEIIQSWSKRSIKDCCSPDIKTASVDSAEFTDVNQNVVTNCLTKCFHSLDNPHLYKHICAMKIHKLSRSMWWQIYMWNNKQNPPYMSCIINTFLNIL